MKTDLLQTAKLKKTKNTTMFEVNDNGREHEFSGHSYVKPFFSFLESLNLDIKLKHPDALGLEHSIVINGYDFPINDDNASFMTKNAYKRDQWQRKPENRFMILECRASDNIRVHINKEIDSDKLKTRIKDAVKSLVDRDNEIAERDKRDHDNTCKVANHYLSNPEILNVIDTVNIEKGIIRLGLKKGGSIYVHAEGNRFNTVVFFSPDFNSPESVVDFCKEVPDRLKTLEATMQAILLLSPISDDLVSWSQDQHYRYFYTSTMSTDRK